MRSSHQMTGSRKGVSRATLLAGMIFAVGLIGIASKPPPAQAGDGCKPAYYRYTERGTKQYVKASRIGNRHVKCSRARDLGRSYGKAYRHYRTPKHLLGFSCSWTRIGSDVGFANCARGKNRSVRFDIYDSSPFH